LLRAWQLAFTRMGKPPANVSARIAATFEPLFPHRDAYINRELVSLLVYLDSPAVVAKTVPLLSVSEPVGTAPEELASRALLDRNDRYGSVVQDVSSHRSDRQQIAYAYALRNAVAGWSPRLRVDYFSWFSRTRSWKGGASFPGFIENIRTEALEKVPSAADRSALDQMSKPPPPSFFAGAATPRGPGRSYTVDEAVKLVGPRLQGRDFANGKAMFAATACLACHRFNGEGSGIGPDLDGSGNRYSIRDLLENIIEPSLVISDQYGSEQFDLADGTSVVGRIVGEDGGDLLLMSNPFMPDEKTRVKKDAIRSRKPYEISLMPPGLINALNVDELRDLLAYMLSGGNPNDSMFR
jgi:putative heme-binding domain-containing protein